MIQSGKRTAFVIQIDKIPEIIYTESVKCFSF